MFNIFSWFKKTKTKKTYVYIVSYYSFALQKYVSGVQYSNEQISRKSFKDLYSNYFVEITHLAIYEEEVKKE